MTAGYALHIHSNVSAYNIDCFNESDGSRRWRATLLNTDSPNDAGAMARVVVSSTGRLFVFTRRSMP